MVHQNLNSHFISLFSTIFQDATLVDKLRDNLMSKGFDYFTKEQFKEAAEFFTEVVRLVCQFQFVPQAHLYKAQCHLKLVSSLVC